MKKKGQENAFIGVLVAVILGVVLLGVIYTMVIDRTTSFSATQSGLNYSTTPLNASLTEPDNYEALVSTTSILNASVDVSTLCNITDIEEAPYIQCSGNYSNISATYVYQKDDYYTGGTTRTIGGIIPILLAVGILTLIAFVLIKK